MSIHLFAQFSFEPQSGCLSDQAENELGSEIQLRHKVATLLAYLIEHRDRIVTKDELLRELWQHGDYRENSLTQSIRELRLALGDSAKDSSFIKTFPQRGYQWIQPLVEQQAVLRPTEPVPKRQLANKHSYLIALFAAVIAIVIIVASYINFKATSQTSTTTVSSLLVLPLVNATDDPKMAWLELGLADMLANNIGRHRVDNQASIEVIPPSVANLMLHQAQLSWPSLPVHIRSLLREQDIAVALFASVRLHENQQVMDFQLIYADGRTKQGSLSYPSLPGAVGAIGSQLLHLLAPSTELDVQISPDNGIAAQALAQGIQALSKGGAVTATKFFRAAVTLDDNKPWAKAYLARSLYAIGQWHDSESIFSQIYDLSQSKDLKLAAFIAYWHAELAHRRGNDSSNEAIINAIDKAELAADPKLMAQSYRLRAQKYWQQMDWTSHQLWSQRAQQLFGANGQLIIEADKFFYLGNPSNKGLEKSPENDLVLNKSYLLSALNFYQQLGNLPMVAATEFAIAQNYSLELTSREHALAKALKLYRQLKQPYELAQVLIYAGFYQMQLHQGHLASEYFEQAKTVSTALGAKPLLEDIEFYLAFAMLDQGLDQSIRGRHGINKENLNLAIVMLNRFIIKEPTPTMRANALVFLGWAYTDLGKFDLALKNLEQAKRLNQQYQMTTTLGYSRYSIMRVHLATKDYNSVIAMANEPITTRLQAVYLARAYFELGQQQQAFNVLTQFKQQNPMMWQPDDTNRLAFYQSFKLGSGLALSPEPPAHITYCESDWAL
ncbi:MAG: winged helix-turn-helix domain-containing protein [Gammaproteobacteria bacterium]|nr:winged helix-turn-helix domain-containing protein [Gammaproteobacteria bacterium]